MTFDEAMELAYFGGQVGRGIARKSGRTVLSLDRPFGVLVDRICHADLNQQNLVSSKTFGVKLCF